MLSFELTLKKFITTELLYYIWINLKFKQKRFFYYFYTSFSNSLSRNWFFKTSNLLKKGCYKFSPSIVETNKTSFSKKKILGVMKIKILENAFLFLFFLHMSGTIFLQSINLTECLRLLLNNINH